jgi:hypothetical protein
MRKELAQAFGVAVAAALGAELVKWGVELARRALRVEPKREE